MNQVHISFFLSVAKCANFAIDIGLEIVILYERIYEIYGDIYAAKNCFDIDAYEMGKKKTMPLYYNTLIGYPSSSIYRWYLYWPSYMGMFSSS